MNSHIYLDYAATTPIDERVAEKMLYHLADKTAFGNPASTHVWGRSAKKSIEDARQQVADLIGADPTEILWTSGATEANNLALKGALTLYKSKGKHVVTVKTEHASVLESCQHLEKEGYQVTYLNPLPSGIVDLDVLKAALRDDTVLVSIMHVNNETGVIQDINAIAHLTAARGILFHVDAVQSVGKIEIDVKSIPVDLMSFSAHKLYGPKGIGALYLRRKPRIKVAAQMHGGGQEQGMRSGTLATHQIVGMGEAFFLANKAMHADQLKINHLRNLFLQGISSLNNIKLNTPLKNSVPNILNLQIRGMKADAVISRLPAFALSVGSACHSKNSPGSYVLRAMGQNTEEAASGIRVSWGRFTTDEELALFIKACVALADT